MPDSRAPSATQLFTVRLWTNEAHGTAELRGSVRSVETGAHRGFRQWSDLISFLADQVQGHATTREMTI